MTTGLVVAASDSAGSAVWIAPAATVVVALVAGFVAWYVPAWKVKREARLDTARALRHNRDPLLRAAFDLQSRFYNIVARDFLTRYLLRGNESERQYATMSTLWVVGQYLGWVEILRREVQYLDLGSHSVNQRLQIKLSGISAALASDSRRLEDEFTIFRSDQRAIGEFMVTARDTESGAKRPDCLGYSEFVSRIDELLEQSTPATPHSSRWAQLLHPRVCAEKPHQTPVEAWARRYVTDLEKAASDSQDGSDPQNGTRLITAQRRLVDLIDLLDPERVRYPVLNLRGRLPAPADSAHAMSDSAHFLWRTSDPTAIVEKWGRAKNCKRAAGSTPQKMTYRGRRGPTGSRLVVEVESQGDWVSISAAMGRRRASRIVDGSLRSTRGRRSTNDLLRRFDRPIILDGSTRPGVAARYIVRAWRRIRRASADRES